MEEITDPYSAEFLETEFLESGLNSVMLGKEAMKKVVEHYFQNIDRNNKSEVRKTLIKVRCC